MARRDMRMVDTNIINGLQNGTGFFASTSLLAIGASFTLLSSGDMLLAVSEQLPFLMALQPDQFRNQSPWALDDLCLCLFKIWLGLSAVQLHIDFNRRGARERRRTTSKHWGGCPKPPQI